VWIGASEMAAQRAEWADTPLEHERQVRRVEVGGAVGCGDECRERMGVDVAELDGA
jgi:hypothetical protein